jgi:hypothetical protein
VAAPTFIGATVKTEITDATPHLIDTAAAPAAGELLVMVTAVDGNATAITWPTGFTQLQKVASTTDFVFGIAWKQATGAESNSFSWSTGVAEKAATVMLRFSGAHASQAPEIGTSAAGTSTAPNPPSENASWGSAENMWIACAGGGGVGPFTAAPTGWGTLYQTATSGAAVATNTCVGVAVLANTTATLDPPAFTKTGTLAWLAQTVVIRPSAVAIARPDVVVGGVKKVAVNDWVVVGGVKKAVVSRSVIVSGAKKPVV